jgi:hypothetical protein
MGTVNGISSEATNADPTWHVQISIRYGDQIATHIRCVASNLEGVFTLKHDNYWEYGDFKIGEWYNLRVEMTENKEQPGKCLIKLFIDNILLDSYEGKYFTGVESDLSKIDNVLIDQRYHSKDTVLLLDNTYFSKN